MKKAVDLLLSRNNNDAQVEIERLSEQIGQPFFINIRPIDLLLLENESLDNDLKLYKTLELGMVDDFNNEDLFKQYDVGSYNELLDALFQPGELKYIANRISEISVLSQDELDSFKQDAGYADAYWLWKNKHITAPSEYFKMSYIDKQLLSEFIYTREKDKQERLEGLIKSLKDVKDPFGQVGSILFNILETTL